MNMDLRERDRPGSGTRASAVHKPSFGGRTQGYRRREFAGVTTSSGIGDGASLVALADLSQLESRDLVLEFGTRGLVAPLVQELHDWPLRTRDREEGMEVNDAWRRWSFGGLL